MQIVAIGEDKGIDLCPECSGVFLDFFDGDPSILARTLRSHLNDDSLAPGFRHFSDKIACPDCEATLNSSLYGGNGPSLFRCPTCAGVFLTKRQFRELAAYEETAYSDEHEDDWFSKLVAAIRSLYSAE